MLEGADEMYVIDDHRSYGKENFWMRMREAISYCLSSDEDDFLILPDDVSKFKWAKAQKIFDHFRDKPFVVNAINDDRKSCWGSVRKPDKDLKFWGIKLKHVDYCDCGFLTNRAALEGIVVDRVPKRWFNSPA